MKLVFHPETDMSQAMAEVVGYVNRARAFMPPGAVPPFIMRYDAGQCPGSPARVLEPQPNARRDAGHSAEPGPTDLRDAAGRFGPAPIWREPAHDRRADQPGKNEGLPAFARRGHPRRQQGDDGSSVRKPAHRGPHPHRIHKRGSRRKYPGAPRCSAAPRVRDGRVSARRRHHLGRHRHRGRLRARQWPQDRLHPGDEAGRRLNSRRDPARARGSSQDARRCPGRRHHRPRIRPVRVRRQRIAQPDRRRAARGYPDRLDGPAIPRQLPQRLRGRGHDPNGTPHRHRTPLAFGGDYQHHDTWRPGPGRRDPGG